MTEKVKLTAEQAKAIEWLRKDNEFEAGMTDREIIHTHVCDHDRFFRKAECLNDLPLINLVDALRIGYEVEPEYMLEDWAKFHHYGDEWVAKIKGTHKIGKGETLYLPDYDIHVMTDDRYYRISDPAPEEIKAEQERRVWAKIGREIGEFQINDSYVDIHGYSFLIAENDWEIASGRVTESSAIHKYEHGNIAGFYPAESFVKFGGGSDA